MEKSFPILYMITFYKIILKGIDDKQIFFKCKVDLNCYMIQLNDSVIYQLFISEMLAKSPWSY